MFRGIHHGQLIWNCRTSCHVHLDVMCHGNILSSVGLFAQRGVHGLCSLLFCMGIRNKVLASNHLPAGVSLLDKSRDYLLDRICYLLGCHILIQFVWNSINLEALVFSVFLVQFFLSYVSVFDSSSILGQSWKSLLLSSLFSHYHSSVNFPSLLC
jgi:hypothetical protein